MKTYMANAENIERKWYVVDGAGMPLGRLCSQVASVLRGKNKPVFTPHFDAGDHVIILNCDKIVFTGKKLENKVRYHHTGHIGGLKGQTMKILMQDKSDELVYGTIKGMLPKNALGRKMIKKLRVYKGAEHEHTAQKPEALQLVKKY